MESTDKKSIADYFVPDSPVGTEFLRLYHNLAQTSGDTVHQGALKCLVTSATLGEGKSTAASFLALTLAIIKKKTLLIDCDLRRPTIHTLFNLYVENGVTEISEGSLPLASGLKATPHSHLAVLTAGRLSQDPSFYFEGGHVQRIIEQVATRFDYIVVDCSPVLPVVDPLVIAPSMDRVIMVLKAGSTHRQLAKEALAILRKSKAPVTGILLNNVAGVLPYHHGHRYAYDYYLTAGK